MDPKVSFGVCVALLLVLASWFLIRNAEAPDSVFDPQNAAGAGASAGGASAGEALESAAFGAEGQSARSNGQAQGAERAITWRGRIVDPEGRPLEGANVHLPGRGGWLLHLHKVALSASASQEKPPEEGALRTVSTQTDAAGRWALPVPPGRSVENTELYATAKGFATGVLLAYGTAESGPAGARRRDLPDLTLPYGGAVEGIVRDEAGRPVPDLLVLAAEATSAHSPEARAEGPASRFGRTDAVGRFRIEGLLAGGTAALSAQPPSGRPGPEVLVDILSRERPASAELLLPTGRDLSGVVVDAEGQPLPGVQLHLSSAFSDLTGDPGLTAWMRTESDEDGRFAYRHLGPPPWTLSARAPGFFRSERTLEEANPSASLRIVLGATATLAGRVSHAGRAVGLEGKKAPRLRLKPSSSAHGTSEPPQVLLGAAASEALGEDADPSRFLVLGLSAPNAQLLVEGAHWVHQRITIQDLESGQAREIDLAVTPGMTLIGGVTVRNGPFQGEPIAGASVEARSLPGDSTESGAGSSPPQRILRRTRTGPNGQYRLEGLPFDTVQMAVAHPEHERVEDLFVPVGGLAVQEKPFDMQGKLRVIASVRTPLDEPRPRTPVVIERYEPGVRAAQWGRITDAQGLCTFPLDEPGRYRIRIPRPSYTVGGPMTVIFSRPIPAEAPRDRLDDRILQLRRNELREVRLEQEANGSAEVFVTAKGQPIAGARVRLQVPLPRDALGSMFRSRAHSGGLGTDERGRFAFPSVLPGPYELVVQAPGSPHQHQQSVTISPGQAARFEVALPLGALQGQVLSGGTAQSVSGISVTTFDLAPLDRGRKPSPLQHPCDQLEGRPVRTDAEGRFRLAMLPTEHDLYLRLSRGDAILGEYGPFLAARDAGPTQSLGRLALSDFATLLVAWDGTKVRAGALARVSVTRLPRDGTPPSSPAASGRLLAASPDLRFNDLPEGDYLVRWTVEPEPGAAEPGAVRERRVALESRRIHRLVLNEGGG